MTSSSKGASRAVAHDALEAGRALGHALVDRHEDRDGGRARHDADPEYVAQPITRRQREADALRPNSASARFATRRREGADGSRRPATASIQSSRSADARTVWRVSTGSEMSGASVGAKTTGTPRRHDSITGFGRPVARESDDPSQTIGAPAAHRIETWMIGGRFENREVRMLGAEASHEVSCSCLLAARRDDPDRRGCLGRVEHTCRVESHQRARRQQRR